MNDGLIQMLFYVFGFVAVVSAVMVITQNNPVRCVLFLVLTFFASAVLWLLQESEFLALILVLVYVGAVMTLFLFVVMMLNIDIESKAHHFMRYLPLGLIVVALFVGLLVSAIPKRNFQAESVTHQSQPLIMDHSNTKALGMVLYTDYFLAFELAAVILLSAIVAAITLVHRKALLSKKQDIKKQLMTQSKDRVRLISMPAEK